MESVAGDLHEGIVSGPVCIQIVLYTIIFLYIWAFLLQASSSACQLFVVVVVILQLPHHFHLLLFYLITIPDNKTITAVVSQLSTN